MTLIDDLPTEVLFHLLTPLPFQDILTLGRTCHHYHQVCHDPFLWSRKAQIELGFPVDRFIDNEFPFAFQSPDPVDRYLELLSEVRLFKGAERFLDLKVCVIRAILQGQENLLSHFVGRKAKLNDVISTVVHLYKEDLINKSEIDLLLQRGMDPRLARNESHQKGGYELSSYLDSKITTGCDYYYTRGILKHLRCREPCQEGSVFCRNCCRKKSVTSQLNYHLQHLSLQNHH